LQLNKACLMIKYIKYEEGKFLLIVRKESWGSDYTNKNEM